MRLRDAIASPDGKSAYVRRLFSTIADRYDLITVVLSGGRDRRWKDRLVRLAAPAPGVRALDLACGTGDIAFRVARAGARVAALDITPRMIALARARTPAEGVAPDLLVGDMGALPFADARFDLVTTGYGLRNVPDLTRAVEEIARVLRPGGRLLSLDFTCPDRPWVRRAYLAYLTAVGGALGWVLHRDPDTYRYIPESIRRHPGARDLVRLLEAHGFRATFAPVLGGLLAIHDATLERASPAPDPVSTGPGPGA